MTRVDLKTSVIHEIVKAVAKLGTCKRSRVGAVIVRDGRIVSTGYNGSPPGEPHCLDVGCEMIAGHCARCVHAESNAIAFAARHGISTEGATIYVYGWITGGDLGICHTCNKLAKSAGIVQTVIVPLEGAFGSPFDPVITTIGDHRNMPGHDCVKMGCKVNV